MKRHNATRHTARRTRGQSTIEFTFAIVIVALLIYGLIRMFSWAGRDNAERSWQFGHMLSAEDVANLSKNLQPDVERQLNSIVPRTKRINAFTRNF